MSIKKLLFSLFITLYVHFASAADNYLTLESVIRIAKEHSFGALEAKHNFLSAYWQYRGYRAEILPSASLNFTLPNFNRSLSSIQNYETGGFNYVQSFMMRNSAQLSIDQNIAPTGTRLSISTNLERMDQFSPTRKTTYINQPIAFTLSQPIWGTFNHLKWNRKIEPKRYEKAKIDYIEGLQDITLQAVDQFFSLLLIQKRVSIADLNLKNSTLQYKHAQERKALHLLSSNELLQVELSMRNDQLALNELQFEYEEQLVKFNNFLRNELNTRFILIEPSDLLKIEIDPNWMYETALKYNGEKLKQEIDRLSAQQEIDRAKQQRGASADLYVRVGYNQTSDRLSGSYRNPLDQENISLGVRIPLLDWGAGKGRVAIAKSKAELTQARLVQEEIEYRQWVYLKSQEFRTQEERFRISVHADSAANELYRQATERFKQGAISVLALTNAQIEKDQAQIRVITEMQKYWSLFYTLEKITLFDLRLGFPFKDSLEQTLK